MESRYRSREQDPEEDVALHENMYNRSSGHVNRPLEGSYAPPTFVNTLSNTRGEFGKVSLKDNTAVNAT